MFENTNDEIARLSTALAEQGARIQRLEDEREISHLLSTYGFLVDLPGNQRWVDLFTEDGSVDMIFGNGSYEGVGEVKGHAALLEFITDEQRAGRMLPENFPNIMHMQGNNENIHIDGDEATANSYSWVIQRSPAEKTLRISTGGVNSWRFRRENGRWFIVNRTRREVGDPQNAELLQRSVEGDHPRPKH